MSASRVRFGRLESDHSVNAIGSVRHLCLCHIRHLVDHAAERDPNFDFAEARFQIAIVVGSVSIVAASRSLIKLSGGLAVVASLLMINGYFLIVHLPFE